MESMTLYQAIQLAVITEQNGQSFYAILAKRFEKDPDVADIFQRLSNDEIAHEATFRKLLERTPKDEKPIDYEKFAYLRALSVSKFFKEGAFKNLDHIRTAEDALSTALNFEKSTKMYYEGLREVLGDEKVLLEAIEEERGHVTALMKVILTNAKFRSLADNWP